MSVLLYALIVLEIQVFKVIIMVIIIMLYKSIRLNNLFFMIHIDDYEIRIFRFLIIYKIKIMTHITSNA